MPGNYPSGIRENIFSSEKHSKESIEVRYGDEVI
jgi:hypothetical protein